MTRGVAAASLGVAAGDDCVSAKGVRQRANAAAAIIRPPAPPTATPPSATGTKQKSEHSGELVDAHQRTAPFLWRDVGDPILAGGQNAGRGETSQQAQKRPEARLDIDVENQSQRSGQTDKRCESANMTNLSDKARANHETQKKTNAVQRHNSANSRRANARVVQRQGHVYAKRANANLNDGEAQHDCRNVALVAHTNRNRSSTLPND